VGVKPPVPLHGKSLFSKDVKNRKYVFAARDKMDETHDSIRAIRSKDYKLILNLMPERPWCQYNRYKENGYPMLAELNVLNLKGQLTPEQAAFLAPTKPDVELYDLRSDPYEVKNLAEDPDYARIKAEMLSELGKWRKNVIHDEGVSEDFRAINVFTASCPMSKVDDWVEANADKYDFNKYGWPSWYPTRSLKYWEEVRTLWEPYVFRSPTEKVSRPAIGHSRKKKQL